MPTEHHSADEGRLGSDAKSALHTKHAGHGRAVTHVTTLARLMPATHKRKGKTKARSRSFTVSKTRAGTRAK